MIDIEIKNVYKGYDNDKNILKGINLKVKKGELITLLGPSGCGKTTLLKMLNKLIELDEGDILIKGKSIKVWNTIKLRRSIGYVIQQIGLFPHMTIKDNINYVLTITKADKGYKEKRAKELIELVGLKKELLDRYPSQLSGGQKQRIGVARALAGNPDIILMDEPFSAVDEIARNRLQDELKIIHTKLKKTIIFVTHDIDEALKLGTRIVIMKDGKIEQSGTKEELIFSPKTKFIKEFIGIKGFKTILNENDIKNIYAKLINIS
ncbi:ATP-binding cassette domain-containing protein [Clostridiaceae bacterium M8S5]|nr:ATP-binding cassette domain-containing protein [Clostridiaceae bacterium M8S5]